MLVLKSILRGEFAAPSSKFAKDTSSIVSEVTTIDESTLRHATDEEGDESFSVGSALPGDSFVLDVDWTESAETTYYHPVKAGHNTNMNESIEDPYLQPRESVRRKLCPPESAGAATATREEKENAVTANTVRSSTNSLPFDCQRIQKEPEHVKSLGIFQFPVASSNDNSFPSVPDDEYTTGGEYETDEDEEDSKRPSKAIRVPPLPNFDPLSVSASCVLDESSSGSTLNESALLPTTPLARSNNTLLSRRIKNREMRHAARARARELREILTQRQQQPQRPLQTAQLFLQLGLAQQQSHDFPTAITSFFQAAALYRHFSKPAALATVLDHTAVSFMQAQEQGLADSILQYHKAARFRQCLQEALVLRKQELGPWHVDTVSTLQNLAKFLLLTGHPARAAVHYTEVVHLRRAIFGRNHPSTAVTAHCLGNAYLRAHDTVAAEIWYHQALQIYNAMRLPNDNPAVHRLLRDRQQLERVERWVESGVEDDTNLLFEL